MQPDKKYSLYSCEPEWKLKANTCTTEAGMKHEKNGMDVNVTNLTLNNHAVLEMPI